MSEMDPSLVTRIPPEKRPPPTARKITLVVVGIVLLSCISCIAVTAGYALFLEVRSRRA